MPPVDDIEGVRLLREALLRAGYSADGLFRLLGGKETAAADGDDALETLAKLFYLGAAVSPEAAARALAPLSLERLRAMEVLEADHAALELVPMGGVLVASDPEREIRRPDRVPGPGKASRVLAAATLRPRVARALDMGTGSGIQALLLARHADEVVATDVNPRALAFARFNAELNGIATIGFRSGSVFEPVAGEQFDLIVSNPPYVVSPEADTLFRDGGLPGDSFSEAVVRQAPALLREGAFAQATVNWVIPRGEPWSAPLRAWVDASGCDAVLLQTSDWRSFEYATSWNSQLRVDPPAFGAAIERWLTHFRSQGIEEIGGGLVVLRRRAGSDNWVLALRTAEPQPGAAAHVHRLFSAQDFLRARNDAALLAERLAPAGDHVVQVTVRPGSAPARHASLTGGLGLRAELDESTADLLERLDPRRTLGEVAGESAAPVARRLIELGFVVPPER